MAVMKIQKLQSGSIYIIIDKEVRKILGWNPKDRVLQKVDVEKKQVILKRVSSPIPP